MAEAPIERKKTNLPKSSTSIITYNMVHNLQCLQQRETNLPLIRDGKGDGHKTARIAGAAAASKYEWDSPRLMILFQGGDINCALHYLLGSLQNPFAADAVATLLIQESMLENFTDRVTQSITELDPLVAKHPNFVRTLAKIAELRAKTIVGDKSSVRAEASPTLVFDFTQNYLGDGPTGVITMHTFRTPKEATQVHLKETLRYSTVTIWNEKLASAYEIVALVNCDTFLLNCFNVDLEPIRQSFEEHRNDVKIVKGYHYETFSIKQKRKMVVFPVGTIFAN